MIELSANDLPASCPNAKTPLWSSHPRIFLDVANETEVSCPYCGTRYRLIADVGERELHRFSLNPRHVPNVIGPDHAPTAGHRDRGNLWADSFGNTSFELMTGWITRRGSATPTATSVADTAGS